MISEDQYKLIKKYSAMTSRLMVKSVPIMKSAYSSNPDLLELLMLMPVKFEFHETSNAELAQMQEAFEKNPKHISQNKNFDYDDFRIGGFIKAETDKNKSNELVVNITLSKKEDESWDDFFKIALYSQKVTAQVAFIYLHETLHIMNRHYDFYLNIKYKKVIKRVRPDIPEKAMHQILNYAFDYYINGYLIEQARQGHMFSLYNENFNGLYDKNLSPNKLSQVEILESILKDAEIECTKIDGLGTMTKITVMGNTSTLLELEGKPNFGENEDDLNGSNGENIDNEAKEMLERAYKDLLDKTREPGSSSSGTLRDLGVDYEVPVDWFHLLKGSLQALVRHHTNKSDQTWGKLKSKFRHISPMPGRIYYEDNLAAIISIDQSGSMSDSDLKKINFVINELVEKTVFVDIIIHDHKIAEIKRFQKNDKLSISEFIQKRIACGGTSHKEVFDAILDIKEKHPKLKFTYLSFSDNYSDIEQVYNAEIFKNVFSFWIMTQGGIPLKGVQGIQISLEEGLLVK